MREKLSLLLLVVLLLSPALAEGHEVESEDAIVRIGEDIVVAEGDTVDGDVVSIGGSITVRGYVSGDAVTVGGSIVLESPGVIEGDAVSIGGGIEKGEGTRVGGDKTELSLPGLKHIYPLAGLRGVPRLRTIGAFSALWKVVSVVVLLIIAALLVLFLPRPTKRLSRTIESHFPRSILFGILGEVALLPLCILLAVSLVGIPLIPIALIAYGAAFLFGLAGVGLLVGEIFLRRAGARTISSLAEVAIGLILIELFALLGAFLSPVPGLGAFLTILGLVILYFAWTVGLGSVILTVFGTREWSPRRAEVPARSPEEKGGQPETR